MISVTKLRETYNKINLEQKNTIIADIKNITDINSLSDLFIVLQFIRKNYYKKLNGQQKLIIEEYKLAIIQAIANSLDEYPSITKKKKRNNFLKKIFASVFSILSPILTSIGSFTGCRALLNLIHGISNPIIFVLGIVVGMIEGALSLRSDVNDVRKSLGVSSHQAAPLLRIYTKQLEVTQKIHDSLLTGCCANRLNIREYQTYKKATKILNNDIKEKNSSLTKKHKESFIRKGVKWLLGGIETTLFAGSGYFMAQGVLGLCASALLATPIGWAIGGAAVFFSLGSFYYLRRKNLFNIVDKISGDPKDLKKSQDKFINGNNGIKKFDNEIDLIIAGKKKHESTLTKLKN